MTPNDTKTSGRNDLDNDGQNPLSTNARDHIFLNALQDLIVRVVDSKQMNDINQISFGPEAEKLITALHEFVVRIVGHSEPMIHNAMVEVSLAEDNNETQNKHNDGGMAVPLPTTFSTTIYGDAIEDTDSDLSSQRLDSLEKPQLAFHKKLLKGLREHIFNTMPIRMLSFEPQGSSLKITLLERGAIYRRFEMELREKMREQDHVPIFSTNERKMETEEKAIKRLIFKYARYAILSHTWLQTSGEVTYSDWTKGQLNAEGAGYHKLVNFCKVAWKDYGLTLGWMDTVCINKDSSSELDESIRSMYNWYHRAKVCIIYLAETETISNMHIDRWFTRGWTLQELLAPNFIRFYNTDWKKFNDDILYDDKRNAKIRGEIQQATTISEYELNFIHYISISRRMQLAATREVTREEDVAYSLMGIFGVSISTAYGEGAESAFFRLLREILASSKYVFDTLNWAGDLAVSKSHTSHVLPSSPLPYLKSTPYSLGEGWPLEPLTLTHLGLRVPVMLMSAIFQIPGEPSQYVPVGDYSATVDFSPIEKAWHSAPIGTYYLLQNRISTRGPDGNIDDGKYQVTLAVFNISGDMATISIQKRCFAKVLYLRAGSGKAISSGSVFVIHTEEPVVFHLNNPTIKRKSEEFIDDYTVNRDKLDEHGMRLIVLYL